MLGTNGSVVEFADVKLSAEPKPNDVDLVSHCGFTPETPIIAATATSAADVDVDPASDVSSLTEEEEDPEEPELETMHEESMEIPDPSNQCKLRPTCKARDDWCKE